MISKSLGFIIPTNLTVAGEKRGISSTATRESGSMKRRDNIKRYLRIFIIALTIPHCIKQLDKNKAVQISAQPVC
jgi:hypothetical protein